MTETRIGGVGAGPGASTPEVKPAKPEGASFSEFLRDAIQEVSELQNQSAGEISKALEGEVKDVHSAMLALQKADLSFQLMMQVRNKIVQAYQDIMRMQV